MEDLEYTVRIHEAICPKLYSQLIAKMKTGTDPTAMMMMVRMTVRRMVRRGVAVAPTYVLDTVVSTSQSS